METVGKVIGITRNFFNNKLQVTFEVDTDPSGELNDLHDQELDITAKKHKKKRSLDANAYFHLLVGKIADQVHSSKPRVKNMLIARYGQQDFLEDGQPIVIKTNIGADKMLEQEVLHTYPCGAKSENGTEVCFYKVYRGSHTYDSKEMSILINGTVEEAKELGIETIPPAELERMVGRWHNQ